MSYYAAQPYSVAPAASPTQPYAAQPAYDAGAYAAAAAAHAVQAQHFQPQAAQAYIAAPQQYTNYGRDELRTIFVTGFPSDVKERELINMCRFMPGYEAASMKASTHGVQQGFVLFQFGQQAHQALGLINGADFGDNCKLRAEMARKNMYVRAGIVEDRPTKVYRSENGPVPGHSPGPAADRNTDNAPCDTLFIGNLSPNITEADVEGYFRNLMGDRFQACKLSRSGTSRVSAFVQFVDVTTAEEVHSMQQGKEMPGSDRGPMRIQFSKNALGARAAAQGEFGKRRREEGSALPGSGPGYGNVEQQIQPMPVAVHVPAVTANTAPVGATVGAAPILPAQNVVVAAQVPAVTAGDPNGVFNGVQNPGVQSAAVKLEQ